MAGALELLKQALMRARRARELGYTHDVYHSTKAQPGAAATGALPPEHQGIGKGFDRFHADSHLDMGIHVGDNPHTAQGRLFPWPSFSDWRQNEAMAPKRMQAAVKLIMENSDATLDEATRLAHIMNPGWATPPGSRVPYQFEHGYIMPLKARMNRQVEVPDLGIWNSPSQFLMKSTMLPHPHNPSASVPYFQGAMYHPVDAQRWQAARQGPGVSMPDDMFKKLVRKADAEHRHNGANREDTAGWARYVRRASAEQGVDTWKYMNDVESRGKQLPKRVQAEAAQSGFPQYGDRNIYKVPEYSYMLLDPDQLRLPWAEFDPAFVGSGLLHKRKGGLVQFKECGCER